MNDTTLHCYRNLNNRTECISSDTRTGLYVLGITNLILAVPTAAANALIIVTILTTAPLQTPSYLLIANLAFSDLAVGLLGQPILGALVLVLLCNQKVHVHLMVTLVVATSLSSCVSVLTVTAISVDRYLAIRLKMQYRSIVTVKRIRRLLVMVWTFAVLLMCSIFFVNKIGTFWIFIAVCLTTCLTIILVCYTLSFRALKTHCAQIQPQGNQQPNSTTQFNTIDVLKYKKVLKTMILILFLILLCYLPLLAVLSMALNRNIYYHKFAVWVLITSVTLNSTLNPIIYMTRMGDLRQACIQTLKKCSE